MGTSCTTQPGAQQPQAVGRGQLHTLHTGPGPPGPIVSHPGRTGNCPCALALAGAAAHTSWGMVWLRPALSLPPTAVSRVRSTAPGTARHPGHLPWVQSCHTQTPPEDSAMPEPESRACLPVCRFPPRGPASPHARQGQRSSQAQSGTAAISRDLPPWPSDRRTPGLVRGQGTQLCLEVGLS